MPDPAKQAWLIVQRLENWRATKKLAYSKLGFADWMKAWAGKMVVGDSIFLYVASNKSVVAAHLRVSSKPFRESVGHWDEPFPIRVRTELVVGLDETTWLPVREILQDLSITKGKENWGQCFRRPIRLLTAEDADLLHQRMVARLPTPPAP